MSDYSLRICCLRRDQPEFISARNTASLIFVNVNIMPLSDNDRERVYDISINILIPVINQRVVSDIIVCVWFFNRQTDGLTGFSRHIVNPSS